jgi:dihydroorotate dehydrogenase
MRIPIAKDFCLTNVYYNASTPLASTYEQLNRLESTDIGAVCTKSCTLTPMVRRMWKSTFDYDLKAQTSFNRYGLVNPGVDYYLSYIRQTPKPYVLSFYPKTQEDLRLLAQKDLSKVDSIEINVSCPNLKSTDASPLSSPLKHFPFPERVALGMKVRLCITEDALLTSLKQIQRLQPDYLVCGNTLPNGRSPQGFVGAVGGKPLKSIGLWNVG